MMLGLSFMVGVTLGFGFALLAARSYWLAVMQRKEQELRAEFADGLTRIRRTVRTAQTGTHRAAYDPVHGQLAAEMRVQDYIEGDSGVTAGRVRRNQMRRARLIRNDGTEPEDL